MSSDVTRYLAGYWMPNRQAGGRLLAPPPPFTVRSAGDPVGKGLAETVGLAVGVSVPPVAQAVSPTPATAKIRILVRQGSTRAIRSGSALVACASSSRFEVGHRRNDPLTDDLEGLDPVDVRHAADRRLDAHPGQPPQAVDYLPNLLAIFPDVKPEHGGLLDLVVVAAFGPAMLAQDVQLVRQFGGGKEIAGVGILRHQAERLLLAATADQDGRMRPGQALWRVERPLQLVVHAGEGLLTAPFAFPHFQADPQRLLEALESLLDRGEGDAQASALRLVPGGADAEPGPAAREDIEGGDRLGQHAGVPVNGTRDHGAQPGAGAQPGHEGEGSVALQHLVLGRPVAADLPEVIHHPDGFEAGLVGRPRDLRHCRPHLGWAARPGEIGNCKADFHELYVTLRSGARLSSSPSPR